MASIAGTNVLYPIFRDAVCGDTDVYTYSSVLTNFATTLRVFFDDNADVTPDDGHDFQADYTAGETPGFASNSETLSSVTSGATGTVPTGGVDAGDSVFTGSSVLPVGDPVESYILCKFITNAAASPVMAHWGTATGLPLTPNGADVTVVYNSQGLYRF